jgi:predicted nucleotidyltransferase
VITVLAALTEAVLEGAAALGDDEAALRASAGLDADQLAEPDGRVPIAQHLALWTAVARRPVGLALGARVGLAGLGVVGYAMQHGATVGDATECMARYRAIVHPDAVPRIESGPAQLRFLQVVPPPSARLVEPVDAQAAATVTVMRILTGREASPVAVSLQRPAPPDPRAHAALFGCPVEWSAAATELRFDGALRALPLPRADPRLRELALFGSRARGEGHEHSDLDVLVVDDLTGSEARSVAQGCGDLLTAYDVLVSPFVVSTEHIARLRSRERLIAAEIARDAVPL